MSNKISSSANSSARDREKKIRGLGDLVALGANPIARMIDGVFKTKLAGCGGCKERQEKLNEILPIK